MSQPNGVSGRFRLSPPPPPVTSAKRFIKIGNETAIASVASASEIPPSRSAGMPTMKPTTPVKSAAIGIVNTGRIPSPIGIQSGGSSM